MITYIEKLFSDRRFGPIFKKILEVVTLGNIDHHFLAELFHSMKKNQVIVKLSMILFDNLQQMEHQKKRVTL